MEPLLTGQQTCIFWRKRHSGRAQAVWRKPGRGCLLHVLDILPGGWRTAGEDQTGEAVEIRENKWYLLNFISFANQSFLCFIFLIYSHSALGIFHWTLHLFLFSAPSSSSPTSSLHTPPIHSHPFNLPSAGLRKWSSPNRRAEEDFDWDSAANDCPASRATQTSHRWDGQAVHDTQAFKF